MGETSKAAKFDFILPTWKGIVKRRGYKRPENQLEAFTNKQKKKTVSEA